MTQEGVIKARNEAMRFLAAVEALANKEAGSPTGWIHPSKESGACRRASLDLTRALAEMRK